jgi:hypothetical protein
MGNGRLAGRVMRPCADRRSSLFDRTAWVSVRSRGLQRSIGRRSGLLGDWLGRVGSTSAPRDGRKGHLKQILARAFYFLVAARLWTATHCNKSW